ncbi:MAG: hypothetical protein QNJ19_05425 [Woeseiaceae bacterium]|nr:hypothetical protein [Woeseiaceae bacterium]
MKERLKKVFATWLAVYPVITLLSLVLDPLIRNLILPLQTLLISVVMVPLLSLVVMPVVKKGVRASVDSEP